MSASTRGSRTEPRCSGAARHNRSRSSRFGHHRRVGGGSQLSVSLVPLQHPLCFSLLRFGQLDARLALPTVGEHQPQSHRHRRATVRAGTHQHVAVEPEHAPGITIGRECQSRQLSRGRVDGGEHPGRSHGQSGQSGAAKGPTTPDPRRSWSAQGSPPPTVRQDPRVVVGIGSQTREPWQVIGSRVGERTVIVVPGDRRATASRTNHRAGANGNGSP